MPQRAWPDCRSGWKEDRSEAVWGLSSLGPKTVSWRAGKTRPKTRFACDRDRFARKISRGIGTRRPCGRGGEMGLIGAPIAPRRVGGIPAPGGGPVGRPGEWIGSASSPETPHLSQALLLRGIAA